MFPYRDISILPITTKREARLVFVSSVAPSSTAVWDDFLKLLCKENNYVDNYVYDEASNEFKVQVKDIRTVEDAMEIYNAHPKATIANLYVNGEGFNFEYLRKPVKATVNGKSYSIIGEFTMPRSIYNEFLKH